jgi:hypothetical protein
MQRPFHADMPDPQIPIFQPPPGDDCVVVAIDMCSLSRILEELTLRGSLDLI